MTSARAPLGRAICVLPLLLVGGCATTGATLGSGVGDTFLEGPPYYAGAEPVPGAARNGRGG